MQKNLWMSLADRLSRIYRFTHATPAKGQWNRAIRTVEGSKTKIAVNDQPAIAGPELPGRSTPIILLHHPEGIQFANLYIRLLKESGSPAR